MNQKPFEYIVLYLSIVPISLRNIIIRAVVYDPQLIHHTFLPLFFIVQKHSIIYGEKKIAP